MFIHYSRLRKTLGLEMPISVKIPKKIARRITMLAQQLKPKDKDKKENTS